MLDGHPIVDIGERERPLEHLAAGGAPQSLDDPELPERDAERARLAQPLRGADCRPRVPRRGGEIVAAKEVRGGDRLLGLADQREVAGRLRRTAWKTSAARSSSPS